MTEPSKLGVKDNAREGEDLNELELVGGDASVAAEEFRRYAERLEQRLT
jgi:hypothetical protein